MTFGNFWVTFGSAGDGGFEEATRGGAGAGAGAFEVTAEPHLEQKARCCCRPAPQLGHLSIVSYLVLHSVEIIWRYTDPKKIGANGNL